MIRATLTAIGKDTNSKSNEMMRPSSFSDPRMTTHVLSLGDHNGLVLSLRETMGGRSACVPLLGTGSPPRLHGRKLEDVELTSTGGFPHQTLQKWQVCRFEIHRAGAQIETFLSFCHFVNKIQVLLLLDSKKRSV